MLLEIRLWALLTNTQTGTVMDWQCCNRFVLILSHGISSKFYGSKCFMQSDMSSSERLGSHLCQTLIAQGKP